MSQGRLIVKNISVLTVAQAVSMLAGLGTSVLLARTLGPENFGILGFGMAMLAYFHMMTGFGSDSYGAREIARRPLEVGAIAGSILGSRLVAAILCFAGLVCLAAVLDKPPLIKTVLLIQGLTIFSVALTLDYVFLGTERMEINALRQSLQGVLAFGILALLIREPRDVAPAAAVQSSLALVVVICVFVYARRTFEGLKISFSWKSGFDLARRSLPFALSILMTTINFTFDIIMLEFMRSALEVGRYLAAYRIVVPALVPMGILFNAFYPFLSVAAGNKEEMRRKALQFTTVVLILGLPTTLFGAIFSQEILDLLFGADYLAASLALTLLMSNVLVIYVRAGFEVPLTAWNRERMHALVTGFGGAVNVTFNLLLIPDYGMEGAALASLLAQLVVLGVFVVVHFRTAGAIPWVPVAKGLIAAAAALGAGVGVKALLFGTVLGGSVIWVMVLGGFAVLAAFVATALLVRLLTWETIGQVMGLASR